MTKMRRHEDAVSSILDTMILVSAVTSLALACGGHTLPLEGAEAGALGTGGASVGNTGGAAPVSDRGGLGGGGIESTGGSGSGAIGTAGSFGASPGSSSGSAAGSSTAGATGIAGSVATGSASGWFVGLKLDDLFPWFVAAPGAGFGRMLATEGEGVDKVIHVVLSESPAEATVSTHNHLDVVGSARAVSFAAKASAETSVLVSVRNSLEADYFGARDAGEIWPTAPVQLGSEWRNYSVSFADMLPAEAAPAVPIRAFTIAFVVQNPTGPLEVWFDRVQFE